MNVATGGVEGISPKHILEIMNEPNCEHVIWLSRRAGLSDDPRFVWILAHELQHMKQDVSHPELECATQVQKQIAYVTQVPIGLQFAIPAELDAESAAYRAAVELCGERDVQKMIDSESTADPSARRYYSELLVKLDSYTGSWAEETKARLCEGRLRLPPEELDLLNETMNLDALCGDFG